MARLVKIGNWTIDPMEVIGFGENVVNELTVMIRGGAVITMRDSADRFPTLVNALKRVLGDVHEIEG